MSDPTQPTVHATISIDPSSPLRGENASFTVTATLSDHPRPITIMTWKTIFDTNLVYTRNFTCTDMTSNQPVRVAERTNCGRPPSNMELGGVDDVWFPTLQPGQPVQFQGNFYLAKRDGEDYALTPGHVYRFEAKQGEVIKQWWEGPREEVMTPHGEKGSMKEASGPPIALHGALSVEFMVREKE